jgi:glutamyl-tRNA reductase
VQDRVLPADDNAGPAIAVKLVALAAKFRGEVVNWDESFSQLDRVDMVVTGTAAPAPILGVAQVQRAMRARRNRSLFLIDLAVPRDVEPAVNSLDNVYLYDIDDLQGVVDTNLEERRREATRAAERIEQEVETFDRWRQSLEVAPTIHALRGALHDLRRRELDRFRRKLGPLAPKQQEAIEALTHSIVQKILHPTIRHLKAAAETGHAAGRASLYREIFGLLELHGETRAEEESRGQDPGDEPGDEHGGPQGLIRGGRDE